MKNKFQIICQCLVAFFLIGNIVIAAITKENSLFSYICCNVLGLIEAYIIVDMFWNNTAK